MLCWGTEYDERIRGDARELGVDVEIFHSNIEGEIVNRLYTANDERFDAAILNPAAFGTGYPSRTRVADRCREPESCGRIRHCRVCAGAARSP